MCCATPNTEGVYGIFPRNSIQAALRTRVSDRTTVRLRFIFLSENNGVHGEALETDGWNSGPGTSVLRLVWGPNMHHAISLSSAPHIYRSMIDNGQRVTTLSSVRVHANLLGQASCFINAMEAMQRWRSLCLVKPVVFQSMEHNERKMAYIMGCRSIRSSRGNLRVSYRSTYV
jgi:hypothetical protein